VIYSSPKTKIHQGEKKDKGLERGEEEQTRTSMRMCMTHFIVWRNWRSTNNPSYYNEEDVGWWCPFTPKRVW